MDAISVIYEFNKQAGLLDKGYDDFLESSMSIEEALEGFGLESPKSYSRLIVDGIITSETNVSNVDRFDKHLDNLVINFGSLFKLGLSVDQVMRGLDAVMETNMTKLSVGKDEHGKQMKPEGFVGPEEKLQKILDENN
jgi:hypothetical protein